MGQEFRKGPVEQVSLGVSHTVAVRCQLGLDIQIAPYMEPVGASHWLGA